MKFIIIGLGSMGNRRIRCLKTLGYEDIIGVDPDINKRVGFLGISYETLEDALLTENPDVMLICTPPDKHREYQERAVKLGIPFFTEASVLNEGLLDTKGVKGVPSCTMRFCPSVQSIKYFQEKYHDCKKFKFYCKSWLPDWHKKREDNYYAYKKDVNGCKEMIPFELCWLTDIFGDVINSHVIRFSSRIFGNFNDYYLINAMFSSGIEGLIEIDVISEEMGGGQRKFTLIRENDMHEHIIIGREDMYVAELKAFIDYVNDDGEFPYSFEEDQKILELTEEITK